ncbi:MAG TPA: DUF4126 domain-containing protein, partial [Thermoanaerobaculia bacterium]|nr:DUF4126 domain-containing protein [Thermoanaerobaculia bacterium]
VLAVLLGLGLSASTGLNTFLPLLLLSAAARFNVAGIELGQRFDWLSSDVAIIVLIVASIVEIIADKVPAVDHFLDSIGTFVRPLAATVATASVLTGADVNPTVAAVMGLMIGAPTSLGFHTLKAATRVTSSAATFGCANPILSLIEDVISLSLSLLAIFIPLAVPVALALMVWLLWLVAKRIRRREVTSVPV